MAKKFLRLALGTFLILALSGAAVAGTKASLEGEYRIRSFHKNNLTLCEDNDEEDNSSYYDHRFRLQTQFMPNNQLSVNLRAQAIENNVWGTQASGIKFQRPDGVMAKEEISSIQLYRAYMTIITPFGRFDVGRMGGGAFGLYTGGYGDGVAGNDRNVMDSVAPFDRVRYTYADGPFALVLVYEKNVETDYRLLDYDADDDRYYAQPILNFQKGMANCLLGYVRDRTAQGAPDIDKFVISPALQLAFGPLNLAAEFQYQTGTAKMDAVLGAANKDVEGLGYYLEANYSYGHGLVGAFYAYFQGDDDLNDNTIKGAVTSGEDFTPLLVAYDVELANMGLNDTNNHWVLSLWMDYNLTEDLILHAAYGYISMNEVPEGWDKEYGQEVDFSLRWGIMDNMIFTANFGYFMPGKFHEMGEAKDLGNAYAWRNELKIKF